jgi:hypothetical protein
MRGTGGVTLPACRRLTAGVVPRRRRGRPRFPAFLPPPQTPSTFTTMLVRAGSPSAIMHTRARPCQVLRRPNRPPAPFRGGFPAMPVFTYAHAHQHTLSRVVVCARHFRPVGHARETARRHDARARPCIRVMRRGSSEVLLYASALFLVRIHLRCPLAPVCLRLAASREAFVTLGRWVADG